MLRELVKSNRSYRRFVPEPVACETLMELIDLARLSATGANRQPLKYVLSCEEGMNERIFPSLAWAGYLSDWPGPSEGERPAAYIVILGDTTVAKGFGCDHGIAAQTILLGAAEKGLGGCMLGSIKRDKLREDLSLDERYEILLVVALGRPSERVVIEEVDEHGSIRYWRDADGVHHVPKRSLEEVVVG